MREMPAPMPKVLATKVTPEVTTSPALSLFARPGDGSIRARRVAILVADGVDGDALRALAERLVRPPARCRDSSATRLGAVATASGDPIEVDVHARSDAVGAVRRASCCRTGDAVAAPAADGRALEFVKDQYRHCKPILALGAASALLEQGGHSAGAAVGAAGSRPRRSTRR